MFYHFSEDPSITFFEPRLHDAHPEQPPMVWAIDEEHAPLYFFPRDCPRVAFWAEASSIPEDIERFLSYSKARMVIAVEGRWLEALKNIDLFVYTFPAGTFSCFDKNAGYFTSLKAVKPLSVEPVGDVMVRLVKANVELRLTPSLYPLHDIIPKTSLNFSMIRMRNAVK